MPAPVKNVNALALAGLLGSTALVGFSRPALADCVNVGGTSWQCSGANTVGQNIIHNNATVTTVPGFSVDTEDNSSLSIQGSGAISYVDNENSSLTGGSSGLYLRAAADAGATPASVTATTSGVITGGQFGIISVNTGTGETRISTTGAVEGTSDAGISAHNDTTATNLSIEAARVTGGEAAIQAYNYGTGATSVTASDHVEGTAGIGIRAFNWGAATTMTIEAASVTGNETGIHAWNEGTGETRISASGTVEGTELVGILATNNVNATDLTIEAAKVIGGVDGIGARNYGTGATSVTATGLVAGIDRMGIVTWNAATAGDLSVTAADASGAIYGIGVANGSTRNVPGDTVVIAGGTVNGGLTGIRAVNGGVDFAEFLAGSSAAVDPGGHTLIVQAANVSGGSIGVDALNNGTGATMITTTGIVEGIADHGIRAINAATATDLTISAFAVTGGTNGIHAENSGSGETSISATGAVEGKSRTGISALNQGTATDLTIEAATVTGSVSGIHAVNLGTGTTSVTASGSVTGASQHGIHAVNDATAANLLVYAAGVSGGLDGIYAENFGLGATAIAATEIVTGGDDGIYAMNAATATDLSIEAVDVTGGTYGVHASNGGAGSTRITTTGKVQGGDAGIWATNAAGTLDLRVEAVDVQSDFIGIEIRNTGVRDTTIIATGTVHGANTGIYAQNGDTTTDLTIGAANVSGAGYGIYAENNGTGTTRIAATGLVESASGTGIRVWSGPAATSVAVAAADVSGTYGIYTQNGGTGATNVTVTGLAEGTAGMGVLAHNAVTARDLTVTVGDAHGAVYGIGVANGSTAAVPGDTTVIASGTVSGGYAGILAVNGEVDPADFAAGNLEVLGPGGHDLTIEAAAVSGGRFGVGAQNSGVGATMIATTEDVRGGFAGISAYNDDTATNLTIGAVNVSGDTYGIIATNEGTGATTVTVTGTTQGNLVATNGVTATNLTIQVREVSGGIAALNDGTGDTQILASGSVGGNILAMNGNNALGLVIKAVDAAGIAASNEGIGATSITATGKVQGGFAGISAYNGATATDLLIDAVDVSGGTYGIHAVNESAGATTITTRGTVRGAAAIFAKGNAINLTNDGTVVGLVSLDSANTVFINNGTWNGAGGESVFSGGASTLASSGSVIGGTAAGIAEATTWSGLGQFTTQGLVTLADGGAGDIVRQAGGNARFEAGSLLAVDIDGAGHSDRFMTSGSATLVGATLAVSPAGIMPAYGTRYTILTADAGLIGQFASMTGLPANTAFLTIQDSYDANNAYLDVVKYRTFASAGVTRNQIATAGGLDSMMPGPVVNAVAALATDAEAQHALDQLSGEVHASARTAMIEDSRFLRSAVNDRLRAAFDRVAAATMPVMAYGDGGRQYVPTTTERFAVWGQAFGSWGHWNGDGNAGRLNRSIGGFFVGADAPVFDTWRVGAIAGYSRTSFNTSDRASQGSSDNYHLGLYGGTTWGDFALRTGAAYTWHDITMSRSIMFPGFGDSLKSDYDAGTAQVFGELAYGFNAGNAQFEPFANLAYVSLNTRGFTEQGGAAALTSPSDTTDETFTTLGLRASTVFNLGETAVTAQGMVGWRHAFGDVVPNAAMFFTSGSDTFSIAGVPIARDAAVIDAGLDFALAPNAELGISYGGQFGSGVTDQTFRANFNMKF